MRWAGIPCQAQGQQAGAILHALLSQGGFRFRTSFLEEAEQHCLLEGCQLDGLQCPVRVLHGMLDTTVLPSTSVRLLEALPPGGHRLTLIKVLAWLSLHELLQGVWLCPARVLHGMLDTTALPSTLVRLLEAQPPRWPPADAPQGAGIDVDA